MQRVCFTLRVRSDRLEECKEAHRHVWPEMQKALRQTGWHNYSLLLRPDGLLIGYLETEDFAAVQAGMARLEVNTRWQAAMAPFFEGMAGRPADESFTVVPVVFHLNEEESTAGE